MNRWAAETPAAERGDSAAKGHALHANRRVCVATSMQYHAGRQIGAGREKDSAALLFLFIVSGDLRLWSADERRMACDMVLSAYHSCLAPVALG